ncbi:unnamed protein product [Ceutorhynchus assimilis]|uniref:Uncharacterized protein n=1 Tax=Ceutorhynchus assimilis TaxID=467358 RepID=A0A9N9MDF5_9CUCU|nr:unnamed protein product [Ceutorhynchus assimilis]
MLVQGANLLNIGATLINEFISKAPSQITSVLSPFTIVACCMSSSALFAINHRKWSVIFNRIADHNKFGKPPNFDKIRKQQEKMAILCIISSFLGIIFALILVLIQESSCNKIPDHKSCGILIPIFWPPEDEVTLLTKRLILIYQCLGCTLHTCFLIPSLIVFGVSNFIAARADHLADLFRELCLIEDAAEQFQHFRIWVQYHQDTIRLCEQLRPVAKSTTGHLTIVYPILLGGLAHQFTMASDEKLSIFMVLFISVGFFICHSGQVIESKVMI